MAYQFVPQDSQDHYRTLGVALQSHAHSLRRVRNAVERVVDGAARITRTLDECDLQLANTSQRLRNTADLLDQAQAQGPRGALDDVITMLESERLDSPNGTRAKEYALLLERAIEVRADIQAGHI